VAECVKRYEPQQLVKGMYSEFVDAWTSVFPKEQLLFLRTEDYKAAPRVRSKGRYPRIGRGRGGRGEGRCRGGLRA
jgi:hypothetical protein